MRWMVSWCGELMRRVRWYNTKGGEWYAVSWTPLSISTNISIQLKNDGAILHVYISRYAKGCSFILDWIIANADNDKILSILGDLFKIGDVVSINDPEFCGEDALIINKSNKNVWLLITPKIDYDLYPNEKIRSQYAISNNKPSNYCPPSALFDINRVEGFNKTTITLNSTQFQCIEWDGKYYYKQYQIIKTTPLALKYKSSKKNSIFSNLDVSEIKITHEEESDNLLRIEKLKKSTSF